MLGYRSAWHEDAKPVRRSCPEDPVLKNTSWPVFSVYVLEDQFLLLLGSKIICESVELIHWGTIPLIVQQKLALILFHETFDESQS